MNNTATDTPPEALRASMVDHIKQTGHARNNAVEQALRTVPRHRFVPAATLEDAYADIAVITKRADDGSALSCASVPTVVAMQLDQLDVQPGHRILEIGAGTGYNAALLARLTGLTGQVTTVDIDEEVTAGARKALDSNGFPHVRVITRDGSLGAEEHAPTTASSSPSARSTCRPPGGANSRPVAGSSCRCGGAARPAASPSSATATGCDPTRSTCADSSR